MRHFRASSWKVNCSGYEREGNGRSQVKAGKLELCNKGTICLDEITEMPMVLQAKLLHLLQNKIFARPGSGAIVPVDVRILAASATNIEPAVSTKKLREDLYYRLSAYTMHVPPLRERPRRSATPHALFHASFCQAI